MGLEQGELGCTLLQNESWWSDAAHTAPFPAGDLETVRCGGGYREQVCAVCDAGSAEDWEREGEIRVV